MSKSALIVDRPENCLRCQFCIRDTEYPQCKLDKALGEDHTTLWNWLDGIPKWCPLISIPSEQVIDSHGYNAGWNDCIRLILKRDSEKKG